MKFKYPINLHKGSTFFVVLALMIYFQNFSTGAFVYLALHGTYGFLWLLKDRIFPDRQFERIISLGYAAFTFVGLCLYWIAPYLLISAAAEPTPLVIGTAVSMNAWGVMLHFGSDAQKYFTLKYRTGLITEGYFARIRNTNYLGETLIYSSFALLAMHWLPWLVVALYVTVIFIPNMVRKDRSLARYPEFAGYRTRSGFYFFRLF
jgi:steroid 5-alpha reductase family enzyme